VNERKQIVLTPIEVSIEDIQLKVAKLDAAIKVRKQRGISAHPRVKTPEQRLVGRYSKESSSAHAHRGLHRGYPAEGGQAGRCHQGKKTTRHFGAPPGKNT
jgi:hypothetical protein